MAEIVLVSASFHGVDPLHGCKFGKYELQQSAVKQQLPACRGAGRLHDFHQLVHNALARDDAYALGVAAYGLEGLGKYLKLQLCGKPYGPHHAQRVVAECYVGVERSAQQTGPHVVESAEEVYELSETLAIDP